MRLLFLTRFPVYACSVLGFGTQISRSRAEIDGHLGCRSIRAGALRARVESSNGVAKCQRRCSLRKILKPRVRRFLGQ